MSQFSKQTNGMQSRITIFYDYFMYFHKFIIFGITLKCSRCYLNEFKLKFKVLILLEYNWANIIVMNTVLITYTIKLIHIFIRIKVAFIKKPSITFELAIKNCFTLHNRNLMIFYIHEIQN